MKTFCCGAVVPGCTATFTGHNDDEIVEQVRDHARADHGMDELPGAVIASVRAYILPA
jgi:predicted small metal-binding protein